MAGSVLAHRYDCQLNVTGVIYDHVADLDTTALDA